MQELLRILQLIQLINSVTGPWEVLHHAGDGELNEETAEKLGDGDVAVTTAGVAVRVKGTFNESDSLHQLWGEAKISGFRYKETIRRDGQEVDQDDLYFSTRFDADTKIVFVEFRYAQAGAKHRYRFKKVVDDSLLE